VRAAKKLQEARLTKQRMASYLMHHHRRQKAAAVKSLLLLQIHFALTLPRRPTRPMRLMRPTRGVQLELFFPEP
jgi:hypothetical protein